VLAHYDRAVTDDAVRIYRAAEAPLLSESGAATSDFQGHEELRDAAVKLASTDCSINRLLMHQSPDEGGLSVVYLFFKPNFPLFRHMHDVDSLYVIISGTAVGFMDSETLKPGDIFTVKAGHPYFYAAGPDGVEVLEIFRDADQVTVIYTDDPDNRLAKAQQAVVDNAEAWSAITQGPLFRANAAV
jgi:mannose-6-phosphate isomerase-like protein (cupin superfamily)